MRPYKKHDLPTDQTRRYLEPGPIVLVSSQWKGEHDIMTMGWRRRGAKDFPIRQGAKRSACINILAEQATPPQGKRLATLHMMLGYDLVGTPAWTANHSVCGNHARLPSRHR